MKKRFSIRILGQELSVLSDARDGHVADVERYVSDKIEEVKNTSADQTTLNIIILAALNIADEYLRLKGEKENFYKELEIKSEKLIQFIEERQ
ncbi:MAG: cell division protein ZapA [Syntrophobacterales bacterium]|nr:cell division protein ZapA [Syntrophobacterales bacterium]